MIGRRVVRAIQPSFKGGLNTTADESQLKADEMREAQNARLTEQGGITKRLGTQRTHDQPLDGGGEVAIKGGYTWRKPTPATHLAVVGGNLFTAPHGSYPLTWSDHGPGLDATVLPAFASFRDASQDVVYIADGGQLHKWRTSGLVLDIAGTPSVGRLAVHNLRLFGCGDTANPETLYFSGLSNGDTLGQSGSGGGFAIVRTFAHEPLTALLPVGQSLLLFHERGISRFTGWSQDDFSIDAGTRGITQDVGTIAPHSVVAVENVGFFMSDRGAYAVTESGVQSISRKIEDLLARVSAADLRNVSAAHQRNERHVWFAIPDLGVMVYDYRLQAWSGPLVGVYVDHSPCAFWEMGAASLPQLFMGGSDGFVRQVDVPDLGRDDVLAVGTGGNSYTMNVRCHRMFFGDATTEKSLRYLYATANLQGSSGSAIAWETGQETGTVALPESGTTALWGAATWGAFQWGIGGSTTKRVHAHGRGNYTDLRVVDDGVTIPLFSRVEAHAFDMGRRY